MGLSTAERSAHAQSARRPRKSCIATPSRSEQVCDGAEPEERAEWELLDAREFKYLNKSSTFTLPRVDNAEEYRVRSIFDALADQISHRSQSLVWARALAAVVIGSALHDTTVNIARVADSLCSFFHSRLHGGMMWA